MADYTAQEQADAIAKLVRTSIRRLYGDLGERRTDVAFSDTQDAAAGVFILYQNSPFYVVRLGVERLGALVSEERALIADFAEAVNNVGRFVTPVSNITPLANARVALGALSSATSDRDSSLARIEDVPAFQRFDTNAQRFLDESSRNIRSDGNIARTPQESRTLLAGYSSSLKSAHEDTIRRVELLAGAIADYNEMNLPATLSAAIIENSKDSVEGHYNNLALLTEEQRLSQLREVTLDLLAARATVRGFGSLTPPGDFVIMDGLGGPFADADHSAVPASSAAELLGPYIILQGGNELDFTVDGGLDLVLQLPGSASTRLDSAVGETYDIDGTNDSFTVAFGGDSGATVGSFVVSLTNGSTQGAQDIADDINTAAGADPIFAEPFNQRVKFTGPVFIKSPSGSNADFEKAVDPPATTGDWGDLVFAPETGDYFYINSSTEPSNNGWWVINNVSGLPTSFNADRVAGGTVQEEITPVTAPVMELGQGFRNVRIRFEDSYIRTSVEERAWIETSSGTALQTLGYAVGGRLHSVPTPVDTMVQGFNLSPAIAPAGTPRLRCDRFFSGNSYNIRTVPTDPLKVVATTAEGTADITNVGVPLVTFSNLSFSTEGLAFNESVLVIRGITQEGFVDAWGIVISVTSSSVTVNMTAFPGLVLENDVEVEVGVNLPFFFPRKHLVLLLEDNDLNDGRYIDCEVGTDPALELTLARPLPSPYDLGNLPRYHAGRIGQEGVTFSSTSTLLDSAIEPKENSNPDTAIDEFYSTAPGETVGTTVYFQVPEEPKQVEDDDVLEIHNNAVVSPDLTSVTVEQEDSNKLLQLGTALQVDQQQVQFTRNSPLPFARIRKTRLNTYNVFSTQADAWVALPLNDSIAYFRELNRLINVLVVNANPTAGQINTTEQHLLSLDSVLQQLETVLAAYQADTVLEVDALLKSFQEKGSDRAVDILLEGRFSDFFGLTIDEVSYAGTMLKGMKDVTRNDLPVRKYERNMGGELIAEYEEQDFEFDWTDVDEDLENVDIPGSQPIFPKTAL